MARFKYSMQNILNIAIKMETQAKQEFSQAANALADEEARLQALLDRKAELFEESRRLLSGVLNFRDIEDNKLSSDINDEKIHVQREMVHRAELRLDEAREHLREMMTERKTHETLKDKAFQEFLKEENRAESKAIDELTSYTYGQKTKEKG
ncbi:MAG: flagellar export protein FliJ [Lachnospiraceae bacterium]|nr:flagellar export protein FliJ [Lachnospiraceae bacterium]